MYGIWFICLNLVQRTPRNAYEPLRTLFSVLRTLYEPWFVGFVTNISLNFSELTKEFTNELFNELYEPTNLTRTTNEP